MPHDPTDLEYDEATGIYGPRKTEPTAIDCHSCGTELTHEELGNSEGGSSILCTSCKVDLERIEEELLNDWDEIGDLLRGV